MLMAALPAAGQELAGWQASVDVLNILTRGNDVHVGDVFTESQLDGGTSANRTLDYGVTYDPIRTRMADRRSLLLAGGYRGGRWGAGARGWRVITKGDAEGRVQGPTPTAAFSAVTGVRMWDNSTIPVPDATNPSRYSPLRFDAANRLEHLRIDGYVERVWLDDPELHVAVRFGVAHARMENTRREGNSQVARGLIVDDDGILKDLTNFITLDAQSEATLQLTGPSLGLSGGSRFGRLHVEWLVNPAILLGTADTAGEWLDIDDIRKIRVSNGAQETEFLRGVVETDLEDRALVPVLDLQMKASVRIVGPLRVGAGLFTSSWFGLPVAPAFSVPGDWIDVEGTGWRPQARDVTFVAYSGFIAVGF